MLDCVNDSESKIFIMSKIKAFTKFLLCALAFVMMSFNNVSEDLYNASFYSSIDQNVEQQMSESNWIVAVARFAVVGTRYAVRYTREVVRVSAPFVNEGFRHMIAISHEEGHLNELYAFAIDDLKDKRMRSLD